MARTKSAGSFRPVFEVLESRELMAADLSADYSAVAFLSSAATGADHAANYHEVGGSVFFRIPTSLMGSTTNSSSSTTHTVSPPAPKPSPAPSPAPAPAPPASNPNIAWCNTNLHDAAVRSLVESDLGDGNLSRADMLAVFGQVEKEGNLSSTTFADLKALVGKTSFFSGDDFVDALAADVINGNAANAHFQGGTLGNLAVGSSSSQLTKLVDKWFLGQDHPATMNGVHYAQATGSLFPHAPTYADIRQGVIGDCYLLSSLAETAFVTPAAITSMFIVNGDGTYTVRFNDNGKWDYVTVDSMLPVDSRGHFVYANFGQNISDHSVPLWVALAEKAYAQINESGWLRADLGDTGHNTYAAISAGYMTDALNQITGRGTGFTSVNQTSFVGAFNAGQLITFASTASPVDASVLGEHAYAVVGYNKSTGQVTLFNPWGINNGSAPGLVTLNWSQLKNDFDDIQLTF